MKSTKGNKGITIIALIITIVVLLILAGVTIDLVVGNDNLFDKARSTKDTNGSGNKRSARA